MQVITFINLLNTVIMELAYCTYIPKLIKVSIKDITPKNGLVKKAVGYAEISLTNETTGKVKSIVIFLNTTNVTELTLLASLFNGGDDKSIEGFNWEDEIFIEGMEVEIPFEIKHAPAIKALKWWNNLGAEHCH